MRIESIRNFSVLLIGGVSAFTSTTVAPSTARCSVALYMTTPEEERASVLSNYLAKSHEEKLKAIKAAEDKKNAEIQALKQQLAEAKELQASSQQAPPVADFAGAAAAPVVKANVESMSKEELVNAVYAYQKFMGEYIVTALEQKTKAVQEALEAAEKKYKTKLEGAGVAPVPAPAVEAVAPAATTPPASTYAKRTEQVAASAAAGKSRWGASETQRAQESAVLASVPAANGISAPDTSLYDKRNARVAAAAAVGKSRWGGLELQRVAYLTSDIQPPPARVDTYEVPPEVLAADHGLRNDGGVGGYTLAERIAMGATAPPMTTPTTTTPPIQFIQAAPQEPPSKSLYQIRNLRVIADARAGKSRWGDLEILMAKQKAGVNPTNAVVEADHGLRADGGVRGPSLADRVNLGAQILGFD
jgi:hypothetical protein